MNIDKEDIVYLKPFFFLKRIKEDLDSMGYIPNRYLYKLKLKLKEFFDNYE